MSIDEGDIYGKRKDIFNKNDWFLKDSNKNKARIYSNEIIDDWKLENKIDNVKSTLIIYGFSNDKVESMIERFNDYKDIVNNELC